MCSLQHGFVITVSVNFEPAVKFGTNGEIAKANTLPRRCLIVHCNAAIKVKRGQSSL